VKLGFFKELYLTLHTDLRLAVFWFSANDSSVEQV